MLPIKSATNIPGVLLQEHTGEPLRVWIVAVLITAGGD